MHGLCMASTPNYRARGGKRPQWLLGGGPGACLFGITSYQAGPLQAHQFAKPFMKVRDKFAKWTYMGMIASWSLATAFFLVFGTAVAVGGLDEHGMSARNLLRGAYGTFNQQPIHNPCTTSPWSPDRGSDMSCLSTAMRS